jgi:hypothetical protein
LGGGFFGFFFKQKYDASGQAQVDAQVDVQVETSLPYDHWVPQTCGPPIIDLQTKTQGVKRNTVALSKKNRGWTAEILSWRRSDGQKCLIAMKASMEGTNYTFRLTGASLFILR